MKKYALATVDKMLYWDTAVCIHLNGYSSARSIAVFFKIISRLGDGWFWYALMLFAIAYAGQAAILPVLHTLITGMVGLAIYKSLKHKTVRPRPYQVHQVIQLGERPLDTFSFPSGHTLHAVLFTVMLGFYYSFLLWIMLPFMLLVAISRMVLGLHYPSDVVVGGLIGGGLAYGSIALFSLF